MEDQQQAAESSSLKNGDIMKMENLDIELVYIEAGGFVMGDNEVEIQKPAHEVSIANGYWMGKYPVTQAQYQEVVGENPSYFQKGLKLSEGFLGFGGKSIKEDTFKCPVEQISLNHAESFCKCLTSLEKSAGRLPEGYEYRLPTESEWEFAAQCGTEHSDNKFSGSNNINDVAWYDENSNNRTHPVGELAPNELGLYDMCGNVWEWCLDDWHSNYNEAPLDGSCWGEGKGVTRVFRGGGWSSIAEYCTLRNRYYLAPGFTFDFLGFRIALGRILKK